MLLVLLRIHLHPRPEMLELPFLQLRQELLLVPIPLLEGPIRMPLGGPSLDMSLMTLSLDRPRRCPLDQWRTEDIRRPQLLLPRLTLLSSVREALLPQILLTIVPTRPGLLRPQDNCINNSLKRISSLISSRMV